jgi:hypothetical protein
VKSSKKERGQAALPDPELLALEYIDHIKRLSKIALVRQVCNLEVGKGGLPPL